MTTELRDIGNSTFKMLLDVKWTLKGGGGGESPGGTPIQFGWGYATVFAKDLPFYKFCVTLYQTKNAQLFLKSFVSDPFNWNQYQTNFIGLVDLIPE